MSLSHWFSYFVAHILEFQMYKSLCEEAGEFPGKDLHKCDFFHSIAAGTKLRYEQIKRQIYRTLPQIIKFVKKNSNGLKLGTSKHWELALEAITGTKELSASALLQYFKPLHDFLLEKNAELKKEHDVRLTLHTYNGDASNECTNFVTADWNLATDLNNKEKQELYKKAVEKHAAFKKEKYQTIFKDLKGKEFADERMQRQIKFLAMLDTDILEEDKLNQLTQTIMRMEQFYNLAKVCPYKEQDCDLEQPNVGMTLDPGK